MQSNLLDPPGYRKLLSRKSEPIFPRELQFQRTIITWHIVTDLFYYFDDKSSTASDTRRRNCKRVVGLYVLPLVIGTWMSIEGHRRLVQVTTDLMQEWWDKNRSYES
ncbi:hypothetical protein JHK85_004202 [Glycine max]|nr:hypothetical protein JHK85_004202 [Glycine max]KAG5079966.1 hypothetical protein JHK86_004031 [Glycine max]